MNRVGTGLACGGENRVRREIRLARALPREGNRDLGLLDVGGPGIVLREHRRGTNAELARRAHDPKRDLAAIRNEQSADHAPPS